MEIRVGEVQEAPCLWVYMKSDMRGTLWERKECFDVLRKIAEDSEFYKTEYHRVRVDKYVYYYRRDGSEGFLIYEVTDAQGERGHESTREARIKYCELKSL